LIAGSGDESRFLTSIVFEAMGRFIEMVIDWLELRAGIDCLKK